MQFRTLGNTGLPVSQIALGTMTWGEQNSESEAFEQIDIALAHGVNLIDVAELYPVPPRPETQGETERILGRYLQQHGGRDRIVLATKATGPSFDPKRPATIRGGRLHFDRASLVEALNGSLARLHTDYIDLYQLHWPDRSANYFGRRGYPWQADPDGSVALEETLDVLAGFVKEGKIRHYGLSNETPWGVARSLAASAALGIPRVASIQNPYSLLNRTYELALAEFSHREGIGLLAYSPLAFGVLSGKYRHGARPANARLTLFDRFTRYTGAQSLAAAESYAALAEAHGLSPAAMALAFVNQQPFVASNIIGATTREQLLENLSSVEISLSEELLNGIDAIHERCPNPAP